MHEVTWRPLAVPPKTTAMTTRRKSRQKSDRPASRKRTGKRERRASTQKLYVVRIGERVALDLILPGDGALMAFVRVDGELLAELPVLGQA